MYTDMTVLGAYFVYMKHLILGLVHWYLNGTKWNVCKCGFWILSHGLILTNNKQRICSCESFCFGGIKFVANWIKPSFRWVLRVRCARRMNELKFMLVSFWMFEIKIKIMLWCSGHLHINIFVIETITPLLYDNAITIRC